MTQKEITTAKKKAKECLEVFNMKVPMTKMCVIFYYIHDDDFYATFYVTFYDVRNKDYYSCSYDKKENIYTLTFCDDTDKPKFFSKRGESND